MFEDFADAEGSFSLEMEAPPASFDEYALTVTDGKSECSISDILFGELWIASGQSNMEMTNLFMRGKNELYKQMKCKKLRIFAQNWMGGLAADSSFPFTPQDDLPGEWIGCDDPSRLDNVSACASAAILELYNRLNKTGGNVPVGFLNASVGATTIETWLPRESIMTDGTVKDYITKIGRLPTEDKFNTHGGANFTQPCALYNLKIAPFAGLRARGTLWYQGESNVASRESAEYYLAALRAYHSAYEKRFAPDGAAYQIICSQLYPWLYTSESTGSADECTFGYLNQAFTDAADAEPDKFGIVTVYDLPPIWAFGMGNHPIHPSNKYEIGFRMGMLIHNRCHGGRGSRSAATLKEYKCGNGAVTLTFGQKLTCPEKQIRGCYIAGDNGLYVEADAQIIRGGKLRLSHPHVKNPVNAAYMVSCLEQSGRLYSGELPVAPFMTDRTGRVAIEPKPWTRTENDSVFVVAHVDMADYRKIDAYPRPTWLCEPGTQLCRDNVFASCAGALRIFAGEDSFARIYAPAYTANRLDMYNYSGLSLNLIGGRAAKLRVGFAYAEDKTLWFDCVPAHNSDPDGDIFSVNFTLPEKYCSRICFEFDLSACPIKAVSMENIVLVPGV